MLGNIPDLNYIIVRPAIVYGSGDRQGITPRLLIGAIYRYTKEKMKMLWTKDLHMNTVHVEDVCAAVWHLFTKGQRGQIYHLADKGNTSTYFPSHPVLVWPVSETPVCMVPVFSQSHPILAWSKVIPSYLSQLGKHSMYSPKAIQSWSDQIKETPVCRLNHAVLVWSIKETPVCILQKLPSLGVVD